MAHRGSLWIAIVVMLCSLFLDSYALSKEIIDTAQEKLNDLVEKSGNSNKKGFIEISGSDFEV